VRTFLVLSASLAAFGCDAIYTDLRPAQPAVDGAMAGTDGGLVAVDAGPVPLADAGVAPDGGPVVAMDAATPASELVGTFEGRGGYDAAGTATLRSTGEGLELVFSNDFSSAAVPGPVVVVTSRSAIGTGLTDADTLVARLDGDSIAGANTFAVDLPAPPDPAFVFVYCEPFGVETARAALEAR